MSDLFDLTGKRALVTGARTGLGASIALTLADAGADIVGLGSSPMPETAAAVIERGRKFAALEYDLAQEQDFAAIVAAAEAVCGQINILVNNAGIIRRQHVLEHTMEDWDAVLTVNLTSVFGLSQAVARRMVAAKTGGRIINIASLLSFQGGVGVPGYTASKHGVAGLTRAFANDLAGHEITVNAIAPGYMETDNTAALRADETRHRQILERIPMGRWGRPNDLAAAVMFLASEAASYVTGAVIPVDGGWMGR